MNPQTSSRFILISLSVFTSLVLLSCAGQIPPSGGPVDTVPPAIIRTVPDTNAVRVSTGSIELEFSKYVDRRSVEESIFISPYVGDLEFDWSGTSVKINFTEPLRRNTTYVVNVGTDVLDIRAHNRMAAGFTLAFATGDSIDHGSISGRVFDEKPEGVMIFAYALQDVNPDTLNPAKDKPVYIMQTGKYGLYTLSHIAYGGYRVFAVRDEYRNLLYDKQIDAYGVPNGDVSIFAARPEVRDLNFRLTQEDTTRPFLSSVRATDRNHIVARISEPIDSLTFTRAVFTVVDTVNGRRLDVATAYRSLAAPAVAGIITRTPMDSAAGYRLTVRGVQDRAGNPIDTAHASDVFPGSGIPDTLKPAVSFAFRDSTRGVPLDEPIRISFSEPVMQGAVNRALVLIDSARKPVGRELRWIDPLNAALVPDHELLSNAWYRLSLVMDSVQDEMGNRYKDTTAVIRFQTLDLRQTGMIEGTVVDRQQAKAHVVVTAALVDATQVKQRRVVLPQAGKFTIDRLPEGKYVIDAYSDADSSGTYSYGLPFPFKPSERFAAYPDTVKVRARWGVQGVSIQLR